MIGQSVKKNDNRMEENKRIRGERRRERETIKEVERKEGRKYEKVQIDTLLT